MGDISSPTDNVTLYDESGNQQGTTTFPVIMKQRRGSSSTLSSVSGSASSVTILAANTARIRASVANNSTAILYIAEGATTSATAYTYKLNTDDILIVDDYTGILSGIWASATGNAQVTETV